MRSLVWMMALATGFTITSTAGESQQRERAMFQPVAGMCQWVKVSHTTPLLQVARQHETDSATLARLNGLSIDRVKSGATLLLPTRYILPLTPHDGIVVNLPERGVYIFKGGRLLARYPVAVGQPTWQTPTGRFEIERMVQNPKWLPPMMMVKREGLKLAVVPSGPGNPIGDRWMGWSGLQVGFHNTYVTRSIGQAASHGCVRLYLETGHKMFDQVTVGMPIYSIYQPIKIGRQGNEVYLSVSPDIYHKGLVSLTQAQKRLKALGLLQRVNLKQLGRIVTQQDGYPHRVAELPQAPLAAVSLKVIQPRPVLRSTPRLRQPPQTVRRSVSWPAAGSFMLGCVLLVGSALWGKRPRKVA